MRRRRMEDIYIQKIKTHKTKISFLKYLSHKYFFLIIDTDFHRKLTKNL